MLSTIEIHNKPNFKYRYEVVVLLALNAWELLLKAYIYKYHKDVKLFKKDKQSKPFLECLAFVASQHPKEFQVTKENLDRLYDYRNTVAHFCADKLDIIVFSLLKRTVSLYCVFLQKNFGLDLAAQSDLVLLPIGFSKPYSPFDFISNRSAVSDLTPEVRQFMQSIIDSTHRLADQRIDEPIMADFMGFKRQQAETANNEN